MEMISVQSSAIAKIGYDPDTSTLTIEFIKGNSIYDTMMFLNMNMKT